MSSRLRDLSGVLVIDKPKGPTSARVVATVKKALGARRVGHTGTLDPMATGVLPLCIGQATKLAGLLLADDKSYTGEIVLGVSTDTLDAEGAIVSESPELAASIDESALSSAMAELTGALEQIPPMYSALKRDGKRLHELARAGQTVDRPPRSVRVDAFRLLSFDSPRLRFEVDCSKGTYVRSLARDLGDALRCGAHLSELRRTRAGAFVVEDAVPLDAIEISSVEARLIHPAAALPHLPSIQVGDDLVARIHNGLQLRWEQLECDQEAPKELFLLIDSDNDLLAIARIKSGKLSYERVFQRQS